MRFLVQNVKRLEFVIYLSRTQGKYIKKENTICKYQKRVESSLKLLIKMLFYSRLLLITLANCRYYYTIIVFSINQIKDAKSLKKCTYSKSATLQ